MKNLLVAVTVLALLPFAANANETAKKEEGAEHHQPKHAEHDKTAETKPAEKK